MLRNEVAWLTIQEKGKRTSRCWKLVASLSAYNSMWIFLIMNVQGPTYLFLLLEESGNYIIDVVWHVLARINLLSHSTAHEELTWDFKRSWDAIATRRLFYLWSNFQLCLTLVTNSYLWFGIAFFILQAHACCNTVVLIGVNKKRLLWGMLCYFTHNGVGCITLLKTVSMFSFYSWSIVQGDSYLDWAPNVP